MDTINNYIENLFQGLPKTEEVLKAKEALLAMMEDKYNELKNQGKSENEAIGVVISEFGNIDELKDELGINQKAFQNHDDYAEEPVRQISLSEAKDFVENTLKFRLKIAIGVVLCILSVVPLIILGGVSSQVDAIEVVNGIPVIHMTVITEKMATAVGLTSLFVLVAIAVGIFIISGIKYEKYNYIKKEKFTLDYNAIQYVTNLKENNRTKFAVKITIGVILCIISVIPVILAGLFFENEGDFVPVVSVGFLLVIIAAAVFLLITAGMERECYTQLLQEEEYSPANKDKEDLAGKVGSVYWPIMAAIYFGWSFITNDWGVSWVVWPIAGILFGAIAAICNIIAPPKSKEGK